MDSSDLYHIKQQFTLGAYPALANTPVPDHNSPDYVPTLVYKARAFLALNDPASALALVPADTDNIALRAVAALAKGDEGLETLRDLCVEIEGEGVEEFSKSDIDTVRVLAATAFLRVGEIEEALETLSDAEEASDETCVVSVVVAQ